MPDPGFLEQLGLSVPAAFAGLAGGVVGAWADGRAGIVAWSSYIGAGFLTAGYLAESAVHVIPYTSPGSAGFVVGLGALAIARIIIGGIKRWHPDIINRLNNDGGRQ